MMGNRNEITGEWNKMALRQDIGKCIREVRTAAKLSQAELADRLGVAPKTVTRWELGHQEFKTALLEQIAAELGVSAVDLLPGPKARKQAETPKQVGVQEADRQQVVSIWVAHMQVSLVELAEGMDMLRDVLDSVLDHLTVMEERFDSELNTSIPMIEELKEMFKDVRKRRTQRRHSDDERIQAVERERQKLQQKIAVNEIAR